ncbi:MAG: hypothetical protein ACKVRN_00030 [Pyrinomonadaceae bacterium]
MFFRAIALFLAVVIGFGTIVPLATHEADAESHKHRKYGKKAKKYKKYSKRWWRQYRARMKRKRAMQAARRALRLKQLRLAKANAEKNGTAVTTPAQKKPVSSKTKKTAAKSSALPSADQAPAGWTPAQSTAAELQFRVDNSAGDQIGSASISVVAPATAGRVDGIYRNNVGGVPTATLRRDIIDRMIKENGWVVNDYQKEIAGQTVYVVVAQSQGKSGGVESRMFYFTEVDGQVYSVATNSPVQESERLAEESEKVINSLKVRVRPTQRAATK